MYSRNHNYFNDIYLIRFVCIKARIYVIVKSHYEEVVVVIAQVRGGAEGECNNNDNLRVQWDLTGFYPIVFDVHHVMQ